jgi:putative transcriptional regulator
LSLDEAVGTKLGEHWALREQVHVSQAVLAAVLNTRVSTVQKWESGDKKPSGPSLKLLNLIERRGLDAVI